MVEGDSLPRGKLSPPHLNPHVCFHFYLMIKGIEKGLVIWSFLMPLKRILETISHISSLWTQSELTCGRGGHSTPFPPPPPHTHTHQPSCMFSFLCYNKYSKGNEKSLVIRSFWKPFKRILEIILISHSYEQSEFTCGRGRHVPPYKLRCTH